MLKKSVLAIALACLSQTVSATFATATQLINACSATDPIKQQFCNSYLLGMADTYEVLVNERPASDPKWFCIGVGVSGDELRKTVLRYAEQHPDNIKGSGAGFAIFALGRTFTCAND